MKHYILGDVVDEISEREKNPSLSGYERFVGLKHYVSGDVEIKKYGTTENLNSSMKVFKSGDILVARRNVYLKRASVVYFDGLTSGDSIVLRAKNENMGRLLPFILNTSEFWDYADQHSDGTMSKRLSPKVLKAYEFDLPDDNELEALADLLWSLVDTKNAYEELLIKTDDLVKSQFIEMFANEPKIDLGSIAKVSAGQSSPSDDEFSLNGTPFIKAGNLEGLKSGKIVEKECNLVSDEIVKKKKLKMQSKGTILVAKSGMSCNSGHVYELKEDAYVVSHLACIKPNNGIPSNYIKWFLIVTGVQSLIKDRGYPSIKLRQFSEMKIAKASEEQMNNFDNLARRSDKSKFELQQAIESIDNLIKSILYSNLEEKKE